MNTQKIAAAISGQQSSSKLLKCLVIPKRNKLFSVTGLPKELESTSYLYPKTLFAQLEFVLSVVGEESAYSQSIIGSPYIFYQAISTYDDGTGSRPVLCVQFLASELNGEDITPKIGRMFMDEQPIPETFGDWTLVDDGNYFLSSGFDVNFSNDNCQKVKLEVVLADHSYNGTIDYKTNGESHSILFTKGQATIMVTRPQGASSSADVEIYDIVESISYTPLDASDVYISNGATMGNRKIENAPENTQIFTVKEEAEE